MTLAPRAVIVHRRTELDELIARHATFGQAAFFLTSRGRSIDEVVARHEAAGRALHAVAAAIPADWRRGTVERTDLPQFLFAPEDVLIATGQDGLVANVAPYLDGQPVVGVDPDPGRNPGVLVRHTPDAVGEVLARLVAGRADVEQRTMVELVADDGQAVVALNEVFLGHASHQTARYTLAPPGEARERQASSGLVVSTGTGATGWCRSLWLERRSPLRLPEPTESRLAWFVREAWPSPVTGTALTEGDLAEEPLTVTVESDRLVAFGDGMEADTVEVTRGQRVQIQVAARRLRLVT